MPMPYRSSRKSRLAATSAILLLLASTSGCAWIRSQTEPTTTKRDKTKKGAGYGAAAGAAAAILKGEREADEILAGAAIGAAVGAGVGHYMDRQEERFARIPGTTLERVSSDVLLIRFNSNVLFAIDSATIGASGRSTLEDVAVVLNEYEKTAIVVQGHTDSTGSEEHNFDLSERRAKAVRNHLVDRGVTAARMTALGYGEGYPADSNASESGRRRNRRVDILLKAKAV